LIRFDSRTVCYSLLLFYSTSHSVLRCQLCLVKVVISVITTSPNHAHSVNLLLSCSSRHSHWWKPTVSWLKRRCVF